MDKKCKLKEKDLLDVNINNVFLHYTNIENLDSIVKYGLEPRIGENSKGVEKTKKVFFTVGDKNALIIMDVWLKWLCSRPKNKYIYRLGAYFMQQPYFPKFIYDIIFSIWHTSDKKFYQACDILDDILKNSCYLVLDLEENVDFRFDDTDEVKTQNFPKKFLASIYKYGSNLNDKAMELWNMHTFTDKVIEVEKISLLKYKNDYCVKNILEYLIEKNIDFVKDNCELLYKFYTDVYLEK